MTNEEKAREVARRSYENNDNCKSVSDSFCNSFDICYVCRTTRSILHFAEWKDEQFNEFLKLVAEGAEENGFNEDRLMHFIFECKSKIDSRDE